MVLKVKNFEDFENKYFDFLKNYKHSEKTLINFISSIVSNASPIDLINVLLKKKGRYGKKYSPKEYLSNQCKLRKLFIDFNKKNFSIHLK